MVRLRFILILGLVVPAFAGTNSVIMVSAPRLDDLDLMAVETAADVTVINRETIEQSGAVSVPDLLQNEANVLIRSTTGNSEDGQISMRGFGENSHLRTLVLVDGHVMNRPDMAGIEWQSIPVSNIEKIEVIRGGQTVLYGNHALAGVVKITSKRGADAGTQIGASFGSFGYRAGSIGYGGALGDVDYAVGASSYWTDGYRDNAESRASSVYGSASWYANDTDTVTFRGSYTDSHSEYPGSLLYQEMLDDPEQSTASGSDHADTESALVTAIWESERIWGAARLASGGNWRDIDSEIGGTFSHNKMTGFSLGPRLRYGSESDFLMGGVDLNYDDIDYKSYDPRDTDYINAYADFDRLTTAPYLFVQRSFERGFVLNGGARYEYARTDNHYVDYVDNQILPTRETNRGEEPNPFYKKPPDKDPDHSYDGDVSKDGWAAELSLAYDLNEEWSTWVGYDRVYRYPTLDEAAAYQGYPLSEPLNEDLDPETGNNFEWGARFEMERWSGSVSAFYMMMDEEIAFVEIPADPVAGTPEVKLNMNVGKTRRLGSELELAFAESWYGAASRWSFVRARLHGGDNDDNFVPLVPWAHGVSSIWFDPVDLIRLTASYTYVSKQYQGGDNPNDLNKMKAFGLVGLRANVVLTDSASLTLSVDNLLDKTYASSAYYDVYYPGAGRSYRMGMTLEF